MGRKRAQKPRHVARGARACVQDFWTRLLNSGASFPLTALFALFFNGFVAGWTAPLQAQEFLTDPLQDSGYRAIMNGPADTNRVRTLMEYTEKLIREQPLIAPKVAHKALELSRELKYDFGKMKSSSLLGFFWLNASEFDSARHYLAYSLTLAEQLKHDQGMAIGYGGMGNAYYFESNYPMAIEWWIKAYRLQETRKDTLGMIPFLNNIGSVFNDMGNEKESYKYFQKALILNLASGDLRHRAEIVSNLAMYYNQNQQKDRALQYRWWSLKVAQDLNSPELEAQVYCDLSNAFRGRGETAKAIQFAQKGLTLGRKIESPDNIAYAQMLLGQCYWEIAEHENKILLNRYFRGDLRRCLTTAQAYHDSALVFYEAAEMPDRIKLVYESMSSVQLSLGDPAGAFNSLQRASSLKDSLFTLDLDRKLAQSTLQYEFEKKEAQLKSEQEKKDLIQRNVRNSILAGLAGSLIFLWVVYNQRNKIDKARKRSDELLLNILPEEVAEELKAKGSADARLIEQVTVLFTDFKGFTEISEKLSPKELVADLHECFTAFDQICERHGLEKIKTIGDAYMAAGGLPSPNNTHASDVVRAALEIARFMDDLKVKKQAVSEPCFEIRIGVNTAPVVAGIVGVKKFSYDIWGDTVNTASRMESAGAVGQVNISSTTYALIQTEFVCEPRGMIEAKGKGSIAMYFVQGVVEQPA